MGRENYCKAMLGLIRSCKNVGWDGDYVMSSLDGYVDEYLGVKIDLGTYPRSEKYQLSNNHHEIPYGFKPEQIQVARERGYEQIIWCDSTIRLLKNPEPYLQLAKERGIVAFDNLGHPLNKYISDLAVDRTGLTPSELTEAKNIMACAIVFDFSNPITVSVFEQWADLRKDGVSFQNYGSDRPEFITHKHDQSCLAVILHKHKVDVLPYGGLAYPPYHKTGEYGEVTFLNKGVE
jgi:hypothetical protein